jgi:hypothetical protein
LIDCASLERPRAGDRDAHRAHRAETSTASALPRARSSDTRIPNARARRTRARDKRDQWQFNSKAVDGWRRIEPLNVADDVSS